MSGSGENMSGVRGAEEGPDLGKQGFVGGVVLQQLRVHSKLVEQSEGGQLKWRV